MSSCTNARRAAMITVVAPITAPKFRPPSAMEKPSQNTP
jgi:hypothetical protein